MKEVTALFKKDFFKKTKKNSKKYLHFKNSYGIITPVLRIRHQKHNRRGCSSMVEHQPSKLDTWVRFPSPAFFMPVFKDSRNTSVRQLCLRVCFRRVC